jgi:glycosyl transferase family 25
MGIRAERFPAIAHNTPALGCTLSHLSVLKLARERQYESVCIFEDDFEFLVDKDEYARVLAEIPHEYDVVMLGWYMFKTLPFNETFGKVIHATTASCYIVHSRFYDRLIDTWEEAANLFQKNIHTYDVVAKYSIDQYWIRLQPNATWLHTLKRLGRQRPSYSDLVGAVVSYEY